MTNTIALEAWAVPRLQKLLPLDDESLKQVVQYANTLSKEAAAEHLKNLLGDGAKSLEFISAFNMRRGQAPSVASQAPSSSSRSGNDNGRTGSPASSGSEMPRLPRATRGKKKNIHALPARQVQGHGDVAGAYRKHEVNDYMPRQSHKERVADNLALREDKPADATQMPLITGGGPNTSRAPPSASGMLVSDILAPKKANSSQASRTSSPAPKTKVNITGGMAMHGASTALSDLDSAIKSLEVQTNPTLSSNSPADDAKRQCNCMATRHPLLEMAPNCLNCGKVICIKQGLGPCTFCKSPVISADEISKVLRVLKDERGEERMKSNNATHKKADVSYGKARALTGRDFLAQASASKGSSPLSSTPGTPADSDDESTSKAAAAKAHRDKLLTFQANNARRTQIHDEAADYDIPASGTNMWASPAERAKQLKQQQKMLREMEWNARPEYEKRQMVASIDLKGGRIVKKMSAVPKPDFAADAEEDDATDYLPPKAEGGGTFSSNPLAAGLIRPVARESKGKEVSKERQQNSTWRRVQMDGDDNEAWILDGGMYGGDEDKTTETEEPGTG